MTMNGFVLVDKPVGLSSHEVTHIVRRAIGGKGGRRGLKIGHAGTLDPFATGLVMVLVGRATRLMPFVVGCDKRYEMTMLLGRTSDSDDVTGRLAPPSPAEAQGTAGTLAAPGLPDEDQVRRAVAEVAARTEQVPPAVSALHIDGTRAYQRVRNGEMITVAPRPVRVDAAIVGVIGAWHADEDGAQVCTVELDVRCASGTYLRALARDVGELLAVGGLASELRRSEIGKWPVSDAVHPTGVRAADVRPMLDLLPASQRCAIDRGAAVELSHGRRATGVVFPGANTELPLAAVLDGELVAMVDVDHDSPLASVPPPGCVVLKPRTVFIRPDELMAEVHT